MSSEPMTSYGYELLCRELKNLREVERPNIIKEIDIARSYGDLKENAEYHAAKDRQLLIESKISEFEEMLRNAQVIDPSTLPHRKVSFGSTVRILNLASDQEIVYTIVGGIESDPAKGLISIGSPIAKSLLGKEEGEEVNITLPSGSSDFEVLEVGYQPIDFEKQI